MTCPLCGKALSSESSSKSYFEVNAWSKIDQIFRATGDAMPKCIKVFLVNCGYDTIISIKNISVNSINEIENEINTNAKHIIQQLDCCYSEFYKKQSTFKLLQGHRDLILSLPKLIEEYRDPDEILIQNVSQHPGISVILREMIQIAIKNYKLPEKRAVYSDIIRYFSTYIFILCGRSTYKVLRDNLPLPSISTVCKFLV